MRLLTMACLLSVSLTVLADGEQRFHEEGTVWVDPVEYFELQDINHNDLNRDYDQGDININNVIKRKGKKVYGLRLKPIAGGVNLIWVFQLG